MSKDKKTKLSWLQIKWLLLSFQTRPSDSTNGPICTQSEIKIKLSDDRFDAEGDPTSGRHQPLTSANRTAENVHKNTNVRSAKCPWLQRLLETDTTNKMWANFKL